MDTRELGPTLAMLFAELTEGANTSMAYMLNSGDPGLLRSLDKLSASAASATRAGGASIAAHVDHLRYGLSLMNRWSAGENPFRDADWSASWRKTTYSETEWDHLRNQLRDESERWRTALGHPRQVSAIELAGVIGSIAHLAYHLGAIRQMDPDARGPSADAVTT